MCDDNEELLAYCKTLHKIELHAHLNGSISSKTMEVLLHRKRKTSNIDDQLLPSLQQVAIEKGKTKEIGSAFKMFKLIHSVVDDEEAISLAACDVVKEFHEDNVKYLELRTTPRPNPETGMTKESYIEAVMRGIHQGVQSSIAASSADDVITVRLLLSVDRRQSISDAYNTVKLAHQYSLVTGPVQGKVIGLDLSGDPKAGNTKDIVNVLNEAKKLGLKLAVHMSERSDSDEDSEGLLSVGIDRIGHGTYLHRGPRGIESPLVKHVLDNKIPIELCMTSNIKAQTVESYSQHHFKFWNDKQHPIVLCTDDKGVFATSLSEEYCIAAETFGLTKDTLRGLARDTVDCIFEGKENILCNSKFLTF